MGGTWTVCAIATDPQATGATTITADDLSGRSQDRSAVRGSESDTNDIDSMIRIVATAEIALALAASATVLVGRHWHRVR